MDYENTKDSELSPKKQTYQIRKHIPKELEELAYTNAELSEYTGEFDAVTHFRALDVFTEDTIAVIFAGGCKKEKLVEVLGIPLGVFNEWMCATDERNRRLRRALGQLSVDKAEDKLLAALDINDLDQEGKAGWDVKLKAAAMIKEDHKIAVPKEETKLPNFTINIGGSANFDNAKVYEDES